MSYISIDSQNCIIQTENIGSNIDSSHVWIGLTQGQYQFSVVAFTSQGPGEDDSVNVFTVPSKLIM